ncbi:hypothetical protein EDD22DRAFT_779480 [Suillus occidentalis]|nr:hypothetical protein EDD22DRAFT_779480 [Suillus occidentalis]
MHFTLSLSPQNHKHTEFIEDVKLIYGISKMTTKKITIQRQWNTAWKKAACALKFVFPF